MPQNLQDVRSDKSKMFLFKGIFGVGKSPAAASFPKPLYFFDVDGRMDSVKKMFPHEKEIYFDTYTSFKKFADNLERLTNDCPYKTVVLPDSLTNYCEMTMDYFIKLRGGGRVSEIEGEDVKKKKGKSKGAIELLGIDDYSAETRAISEMLQNAKYLAEEKQVNIITIAHIITTTTSNIKTGTQSIEKFLLTYGKKAAGKIPTLYGEIYHFFTQASIDAGEGEQYLVRTVNDGDDFARSSYHLPKVVNWTNRNFYHEILPYFSEVRDSPMELETEQMEVNNGL